MMMMPNSQRGRPYLKCQNQLLLLTFLGSATLYILRVSLSVAIVAMAGQSQKSINANVEEICSIPENLFNNKTQELEDVTEFDWDEKVQGRLLASYFYGYFFTNPLGGFLGDKYGGKRVLGTAVLLTSVLSFIIPSAARTSANMFAFVRFLQGLAGGVSFPAIYAMIAEWVQESRRSLFLSIFIGGIYFGTILILSLGGLLANSPLGWPSVFHLSGVIGLIWTILWTYLGFDSPTKHPFVGEEEKLFLLKEIGRNKSRHGVKNVPWLKIFTSLPFIALVVANVGDSFGYYCLLTEMPTYLSTVHHFSIRDNGLVSSLPYLTCWVCTVVFGRQLHRMTEAGKVSVRAGRRVASAVGMLFPMVMMVGVAWAGCHAYVAVLILCLAVGVSGVTQCGSHCSLQDLAPNYTGTLTGISNCLSSIPGFLAPSITGIIIQDKPTVAQWNKVFCLNAAIYFFTCCFYLKFMSAEVQPWNAIYEKVPLNEDQEEETALDEER